MCDPRVFVLLLTVVAFVLPTLAAILAYRSATAAMAEADFAAAEHDRILADSRSEMATIDPTDADGRAAVQEKYAAQFAAIGYPAPTYTGMVSGPAHATSRAVRAVLRGAKANAWLALTGLVSGLAASVWSLYLPG